MTVMLAAITAASRGQVDRLRPAWVGPSRPPVKATIPTAGRDREASGSDPGPDMRGGLVVVVGREGVLNVQQAALETGKHLPGGHGSVTAAGVETGMVECTIIVLIIDIISQQGRREEGGYKNMVARGELSLGTSREGVPLLLSLYLRLGLQRQAG